MVLRLKTDIYIYVYIDDLFCSVLFIQFDLILDWLLVFTDELLTTLLHESLIPTKRYNLQRNINVFSSFFEQQDTIDSRLAYLKA